MRWPWGFTSLEDIRAAYSVAFPDNERGIKSDEIDDVLADKKLDALSLVRNLLVHKAGRADQRYVEERAGVPDAPELEVGHQLLIDGAAARDFVQFAYTGAVGLTQGVDTWMAKMRASKAT